MKIIVNGDLTYECRFPVKLGDKVLLPDTGWRYNGWIGTVTALDSSYNGYLNSVIEVIGSPLEMAVKEVKNLEAEAKCIRKQLKEARTKVLELTPKETVTEPSPVA